MAHKNLDNKILTKLLEDGRASFRSIADDLDVSVTTISNHVDTMQKQGIIKGFKPILNHSKIGYTVTCVLMIKPEGQKIEELTEELENKENLTDVYEVTGDFDLIAIGKFKDTEDMNRMIKEILNHESVNETNTNVVLSNVKENAEIKLN